MTHRIVTRVALVLVLLALGAAALFAALVGPRTPPRALAAASIGAASGVHPGAALFEQYCRRCHDLDEAVQQVRGNATPRRGTADVRDFLRRHGRADDAQDAQIVDYLLAAPTIGPGTAPPKYPD